MGLSVRVTEITLQRTVAPVRNVVTHTQDVL